MNHLFIIRHAEDLNDSNQKITPSGIDMLKFAARDMNSIIGGTNEKIYLASSKYLRAINSSKVVAEELGIIMTENDLLNNCERMSSTQLDELYNLVSSIENEYKAIILMTHVPNAQFFSAHFMKKRFDKSIALVRPIYASFIDINCLDSIATYVRLECDGGLEAKRSIL